MKFMAIVWLLSLATRYECANKPAPLVEQVIFYELKPFIYYDENKELQGIFRNLFVRIQQVCNQGKPVFNFTVVKPPLSYVKWWELTERQDWMNATELKNVQSSQPTIWLTVLSNTMAQRQQYMKNNLIATVVYRAPGIAMLVHKKKVTIIYKLYAALARSQNVLLLNLMIIAFVAILVWLAECLKNKDFSNWFLKGIWTSLYWTFVTMTTVGYGDVTTHSVLGRFISVVWMTCGIFLLSTLTGTFSATMSDTSYLDFQNSNVSVLTNSYDASVLLRNYNAKPLKTYTSYDQIVEDIQKENVDFGFINVDVLTHMDLKKYEDVVTVRILDVTTPVVMVHSATSMFAQQQNHSMEECISDRMQTLTNDATDASRVEPTLQTEFMEGPWDFLTKNEYTLYPLIALLAIVVFCIFIDGTHFMYNYTQRRKDGGSSSDDVPLTVMQNGHAAKKENSMVMSSGDVKQDIRDIKEQVMKLNAMKMYKQKCPVCSWQT